MLQQINSRFDGKVLYECEADSLLGCLQKAVKQGADLRGANFQGADFQGADLQWANLQWADLRGANFQWADFQWANLRGADLRGADLQISTTIINWNSHALIAELLRRNAGDDPQKRMIAGGILISIDWCWNQFLKIEITLELKQWVCATLKPWVKDGDNAPDWLKEIITK